MEQNIYKVLIADDEYWAREKIRTMIDWKEYGLYCLKPAVDGEEVLRKIEEEQPDILITDINMPFINGVELLQILHEKHPDIITFVISGYDDFEYVKNTFLSGSINYLIKPVNKIDLVNALSKAMEIIGTRQEEKKKEAETVLELRKAASLIQDREFSSLVEKEETPFAPSITMNQEMDFAGYSLVYIKIHNMAGLIKAYGYDMSMMSYSIKKELRELAGNEKAIIFNHIYRANEFILISELDNAVLRKIADKMVVRISVLTQAPVSVVISEHSYSLDSIHMAYIQTVSAYMMRTFTEDSVILMQDTLKKEGAGDVSGFITEEIEQQLRRFIKGGNWQAAKNLIFDSIGLRRCKEEGWTYLRVKQTVKRIFNILTDYRNEAQTPQDILNIESLSELADKTVESLQVKAVCDVVEEGIDYISSLYREEITDSVKDIVRQIAAYIDGHYFEEISLSQLAKEYGVEHSYLSKMFRQEMKENLILYLSGKRVEKAIAYMKQTEHNLTEIAFMVGYDDYTYFSRVFRKVTGKSPREYKNSL